MVFYGADVDALRNLAASMERSASTLTGSVGAVDGAVMRATAWKGPAADRFRAQWSSSDRRQITSLASTLQDYARRLRANADAQAQTSAAGSGALAGVGSATSSTGTATIDWWQTISAENAGWGPIGLVGTGISVFNHIVLGAHNAGPAAELMAKLVTGETSWTKAFQEARALGNQVLTLDDADKKAMSVLGEAAQRAEAAGSHVVPTLNRLDEFASKANVLGKGLGYAGAAVSAVDLASKLHDGTATPSDVLGTLGTTAKASGNPYAYVAGVGLSIASTDAALLQKTDLSAQGTADTFAYMRSNPGAIGKALVGAIPETLHDLVGWF